MQRWEYLTILVKNTNWTDSLGRSGELPYHGQATGLLNDLGELGWDLAGVHGLGDNYHYSRLFLKRPRP